MTVIAVVATRNEPELAAFLARLAPRVDQIIVADESDDLGAAVDAVSRIPKAKFLTGHGGIGPSLVDAWRLALKCDTLTWVVQLDAGGSHDPRDIPVFFGVTTGDIVVGSRFLPHSSYRGRRWRALASAAYSWRMSWRTGETITDWTSGYRLFSKAAVAHLAYQDYQATMHGWQTEVLLRALDAGMDVIEVPISYTAGRSSLRWRDVREALRVS